MADMVEKITDHEARAKARLITQYKNSVNIEKIISIYAKKIQEIEDQAFKLLDERSIDTAVGYNLDVLGIILNEPRIGLSDDDYRLLLKAKIAQNVSEGTIEDIIGIFRMLLRPEQIYLNEVYPAGFELTSVGATMPITSNERVKEAIRRAKAAGVQIVDIKVVNENEFAFLGTTDPTAKGFRDINILKIPINPFRFSNIILPDGSGETGTEGFADINNPGTGGALSYFVETDLEGLDPNSGRLASII